ncbi:sigma-70 family RNA polymerase sigma factor [Pedobacter gandavensis]|uniref:RNA polymerase sigma factor n=1 Tax=Pedobacter gandavensis TaxID=2679963 RepID=UPI00292EA6D7|nr:sigma-70 family RNA polymerase sigma factor [Pedobacter gandavensis]
MQSVASEVNSLPSLWLRIKDGEEQALFTLYKTLYSPLYNYGFLVCKERETVEDAINQIFLEIWDSRSNLKPVSNVKSYLFTYIRRKINKEKIIESKKVLPVLAFYEQSIVDCIEELQLEEEMKQRIFKAIDKLSVRQKELIMLRYYENLNYDEIAERTGMATQTAYNNMHQALRFLKDDLKVPVYIIVYLLKL